MRVLICSQEAPLPPTNGERLLVEALVREMKARHEVRVLGFLMPDQRPEDHANLRLVPLPIATRPQKARAFASSVARHRPHGVDAMAAAMAPALREELASFDPDVVHVSMGPLAALGRHLGGRASVLAALDAWHITREAQAKTSSGLRRLAMLREARAARAFEARDFALFGRVVAVTDDDRDALLALRRDLRIETIPNGVDTVRFTPGSTAREPGLIVFHGRMGFAPNVTAAELLAREVLPRVRARQPDARLAIVGAAPSRAVSALEALDGVTVTGEVDDVVPWLRRAAVYVCAVVSGTGIKNKLLEAMACGAPCVATPRALQGIRCVAGEEVLVASSPDELADRALAVMRDGSLAARLGAAARAAVVARHSWEACAREYERVYSAVIAERAAK